MLKGIWILEDTGPCLYRLIVDKRFFEVNEDLVSGFFAALDNFAKSIGSEEVAKLDLKDVTFSFIKTAHVIIVVAADKDEDVTQTLLRVRHTFGEVIPNIEKSPFNPLVPSDLDELAHKLTPKVRGIVSSASGSSGKQDSGVEGYMIPILEKPLTRMLRERDQLAKRFGVIAVDVLRHANGKQSVEEISVELRVEQMKVEDILAFAHRLGIIEFKLRAD
jgi:hypothetical protein